MTAAMNQTVKVYIANFEGCTTRAGFILRLARAFSIDMKRILKGEVWRALCERVGSLATGEYPVRVRVMGLDEAYPNLSSECESLIRILRAAQQRNSTFRAEAVVGNMKWKV